MLCELIRMNVDRNAFWVNGRDLVKLSDSVCTIFEKKTGRSLCSDFGRDSVTADEILQVIDALDCAGFDVWFTDTSGPGFWGFVAKKQSRDRILEISDLLGVPLWTFAHESFVNDFPS